MAPEERVTVKTTVPRYQKDEWVAHADDMDMTQAEFVRSMVQAGRRDFEIETPEPTSQHDTPGVDGLEDRVLGVLADGDRATFEQIVAEVTVDIESSVDEILQRLDDEGRVTFSNLDGYALAGGHDGDH